MASILLLSGGFDSALLGYQLSQDKVDFSAVYMNFGQDAAERELSSARLIAAYLDIRLDVIDLTSLRTAFASSLMPGIMSHSGNPGSHVLELGTMIMYGPLLPYARQRGFEEVYIALVKSDADASPEYTQAFLDGVSRLSELAGYSRISFKAPFVMKEKQDLLTSVSLDPKILGLTWSCILGGQMHCGVCRSCKSRKAAFQGAGVTDLTNYRVL